MEHFEEQKCCIPLRTISSLLGVPPFILCRPVCGDAEQQSPLAVSAPETMWLKTLIDFLFPSTYVVPHSLVFDMTLYYTASAAAPERKHYLITLSAALVCFGAHTCAGRWSQLSKCVIAIWIEMSHPSLPTGLQQMRWNKQRNVGYGDYSFYHWKTDELV